MHYKPQVLTQVLAWCGIAIGLVVLALSVIPASPFSSFPRTLILVSLGILLPCSLLIVRERRYAAELRSYEAEQDRVHKILPLLTEAEQEDLLSWSSWDKPAPKYEHLGKVAAASTAATIGLSAFAPWDHTGSALDLPQVTGTPTPFPVAPTWSATQTSQVSRTSTSPTAEPAETSTTPTISSTSSEAITPTPSTTVLVPVPAPIQSPARVVPAPIAPDSPLPAVEEPNESAQPPLAPDSPAQQSPGDAPGEVPPVDSPPAEAPPEPQAPPPPPLFPPLPPLPW